MSDPRFTRLKLDPRFRRPRKKESKIIIDDRFKSVLAQDSTKIKGKTGMFSTLLRWYPGFYHLLGRVDKYGRQISDNHEKDNLTRFYHLDDHKETEPKAFLDYARGEVLLESSDEDQEPVQSAAQASESDEEDIGHDRRRPISVFNDADTEIDLDETSFADLDAQATAYNTLHPEISEEGTASTYRIAAVNLDWEHVHANHLFKICSSLVSSTAPVTSTSSITKSNQKPPTKGAPNNIVRGKVVSVRIYPSEFGKERMAREETEGPPSEIFKKNLPKEINAQTLYDIGDEDDYDRDALRKYQLERLRFVPVSF